MSNKIDLLRENRTIPQIATNNDTIEEAFENTLSRDGSTPNEMNANLDMNGHRILNLVDAVHNQEPITLSQAATLAAVENPLTREIVGSYLYPRTAQEIAGSVTPTNYYYLPGDIRRYGAACRQILPMQTNRTRLGSMTASQERRSAISHARLFFTRPCVPGYAGKFNPALQKEDLQCVIEKSLTLHLCVTKRAHVEIYPKFSIDPLT